MAREKFKASAGALGDLITVTGSDNLPDETVVKLEEDNTVIEVKNDTPKEDQGRPDNLDNFPVEDTNTEVRGSTKVEKRINRLKAETHTERRGREKAERERNEAIQYAQQQKADLDTLRRQVARNAEELNKTTLSRNESALKNAQQRLANAHEEGDSAEIAAATVEISELSSESTSIRAQTPAPQTPAPQPAPQPAAQPAPQPAAAPAGQPLAPKVAAWIASNSAWFQQPGHEAKTSKAMSIHWDLTSKGISPQSDEYVKELDKGLKSVYPEHNAGQNSADDTYEEGQRTPSRTNAVSQGSRSSNTTPRTVTLTASQVAIAKSLGVPLSEYARSYAKAQTKIEGTGA